MNISLSHVFIGIYKLHNIIPAEGASKTTGEPRKPSIIIILVPNKLHPWNIEAVFSWRESWNLGTVALSFLFGK